MWNGREVRTCPDYDSFDCFLFCLNTDLSFSTGYQAPWLGGARGVMVTVLGNGHGDMSSNPGRD